MATLNLSIPDELKSYIKTKASEMNTTVSEIFVNYVKNIKEMDKSQSDPELLNTAQRKKISLARDLAGSIKVDFDNIDDVRLQHLLQKHLKNE